MHDERIALRSWLEGVRVLELSSDVNGASVAGSLLTGFGATVDWVDLGDRDTSRLGLARLQQRKRASVTGAQAALASHAWDVVIGDRAAALLSLDGFEPDGRAHAAVTAWVTPYGLGDVGQLASELTLQADTGIVAVTGHPDSACVRAGFSLGCAAAGLVATTGICAALSAGNRGAMQLVDVATFDTLYQFMATQLPGSWLHSSSGQRGGNTHPMAAPWNAYRCRDEWVVICTMSERQWSNLCRLIGRADWAENPSLQTAGDRVAKRAEIDAELSRWAGARTAQEVVGLCSEAGISAGPVRTHEQARAMSSLDLDTEPDRPPPGRFVPALDVCPPAPTETAPSSSPLRGLRILELGTYTSAPIATRLLAGLGADVIKTEPARGEACRELATRVNGVSYLFHLNNTDKSSVTLDIGTTEGREALRARIGDCDAVVSNLSRRTLRAAGLDPARLRADMPGVLHCMITGFASGSPDSERPAFDTVVQGMAGLMELTGFPEDPPVRVGVSAVDVLGGLAAAAHVAAWWYRRRRGGPGGTLEIPLMDTAVWACAQSRPDASRTGNAVDSPWPEGILETLDRPVAWSVMEPQASALLSELVPVHEQDVAGAMECWARTRRAAQVVSELRARGFAAVVVSSLDEAADHPAARRRHMLQVAPAGGAAGLPARLLGYPLWLDGRPLPIRHTAPATPGDDVTSQWTALDAAATVRP